MYNTCNALESSWNHPPQPLVHGKTVLYEISPWYPKGWGPLISNIAPRIRLRILSIALTAAAAAKLLQSCLTLCNSIDGSPPGSPVPGILQARTLEWVAISSSSAWKWKVKVKSLSCQTLSNHMDCSPQGSSVHGIFQARVLEWGAIAFSTIALKEERRPLTRLND